MGTFYFYKALTAYPIPLLCVFSYVHSLSTDRPRDYHQEERERESMYERYTKVVEAEFPRMMMHSTIPMGAPLAVVFDHYRLERPLVSEWRQQVNLFFLNGTGMNKSVWRYHINRVFEYSQEHDDLPWQVVNCVAVDLVNHGDSAVENSGIVGWQYDWREGAHDLIQVAKSLRLQGTSVVIGHSMGGFQALYSTLISPLMFKFVISIEPVTHGSPEVNEAFSKKMLPAVANAIKTEFKNEQQYDEYMRNQSFYRKFHPQVLNDFIEAEKTVHKDGSVSAKTSKQIQMICYHAGLRIFPLGLSFISNVECPIVYIVGEKATWTPKSNVTDAIKVMQRGELVEIPNGEHLVNGEDPDAIVDIVLRSLSKHVTCKETATQERCVDRKRYKEIFDSNYAKLASEFFEKKPKL